MPPCAVKRCAVRPVFARAVGELRAADPSNVQGLVKQKASPGEQSEAPRPRWKQGQKQNLGPENQDSQHMLEQPRGYFPDKDDSSSPPFPLRSQDTWFKKMGVMSNGFQSWESVLKKENRCLETLPMNYAVKWCGVCGREQHMFLKICM